jgi:hypothetical protein
VPEICGVSFAGACTWIEKGAREALWVPSLTLMTMFESVPTSAVGGVPESCPVAELKLAHGGAFATLKVTVLPSGSDATGVKEYWVPAMTVASGVPAIVGALLAAATTWTEKAGSDTIVSAPATLIRILAKVPTFALVGVPTRAPVLVLKVAHPGRLTIEKVKLSPRGALTTGRKLKAWPAVMLPGGVPAIVGGAGGVCMIDGVHGMTTIRNGPTVARLVPSDTTICIAAVVPTSSVSGTPESSPFVSPNVAQSGLFVMLKDSTRPSALEADGIY